MMKKRMAFLGMVALAMGITVGCANSTNDGSASADGTYSGVITAAGSTALQPLAEEAANSFMDLHPSLSVTVQGGGSGTGVNQVASGTVNIGNSDIPSSAKLEDDSKGLVDTKVAALAFSLVVNEDVTVDSLTVEEIQGIFSGEITNWSEVGGDDLDIQVINRPASSGTRVTFVDTVMGDVSINDAIGTIQESNGAVESAVNATSGAISYLAMSYLTGENEEALITLAIDGVKATTENVVSGDYPFWGYQFMITQGEPTNAIASFIEYVQGEDFASVVNEMGYISMSELE